MTKNFKRILYVIPTLEVGGAEHHLTQVMTGLKKDGWEPEIFVLKRSGAFIKYLEKHSIPIYNSSPCEWLMNLFDIRYYRMAVTMTYNIIKMIHILWQRRPHIIHFFLPASYITGAIASFCAPVPVRIMSRRSRNHYQKKHNLLQYLEYKLHSYMTMITGNSLAVIKDLKEEGIGPNQLKLIYNGVDTHLYVEPIDHHIIKSKQQVDSGTLVFIMVANLKLYKGHSDLIEAFNLIKNKLLTPWIVFCIGRDDGIRQNLQDQIDALGLRDNFRFLGCRSDVPTLLKMADIGILCSHQEGFSNAVIEGMAAELPMVVTDVGGNAEAVIDGENGYVVPPNDPPQLATALLKLAFNPDRKKMGQKGKHRVIDNFSMTSCIENYKKLYEAYFFT